MSPLEKINKEKYCHLPKDYGDNTEQCNELKKAIENAIKRGELNEFIDSAASKSCTTGDIGETSCHKEEKY